MAMDQHPLDYDYAYHSPGTMPGTLQLEENADPPHMSLIDYDQENWLNTEIIAPEDCQNYIHNPSVSWVDIGGLGNQSICERLGQVFSLHQLILEDVVNVPQRPKVEAYSDQLLIITQMVGINPHNHNFWMEQVSIILSQHYVLTFQEEPDLDCFEPIRDRIKFSKGGMRNQGSDYLCYSLWDAIIDGFFPVLEFLGDRIEEIEDQVIDNPTPQTLAAIHQIKRELLTLRRAMWPQRDALSRLIRDGDDLIRPEVLPYFRDCYDNTVMIIDVIETYRELASGLMDVYLSASSNRMNEVMQLLTVISTIFIPLTFIAGIYGMNFNTATSPWNMPELNWPFGYFLCISLMAVIAAILLYFFWRRGWLRF
jgi:magnesium transporter